MSDPVSLASLFDAAEQAAIRGDFAAAARLLGQAARAQEAALGPDHLDLANTLNNLAVAHERCGQLDAAEREYRRAHAIAARTRPADDPLVTTTAQNLREFCQANGRPVDVPPSALTLAQDVPDPIGADPITLPGIPRPPAGTDAPTVRIERLTIGFASEPGATEPAPARPRLEAPAPKPAPIAPAAMTAAPKPRPVPAAAAATTAPAPSPPVAPRRRVSIPVLVALGAIAALVIWLLVGRGSSAPSGDTTAAASDTAPNAPSTTPTDAAPSGTASGPPAAAPVAPRPAPASASAGGVTIGDAQLCRSLSSSYQCDAAGSTVRPGRLVFYTRLVADHNTSVVHRWYRGNELRQSIRLDVPARRQGFSTFSRTTVSASDGEWRVELRTRDGQLLHTERFTVR
jgi:Protein of unknown function (DUF2914)/Tetratricopeptide repeat